MRSRPSGPGGRSDSIPPANTAGQRCCEHRGGRSRTRSGPSRIYLRAIERFYNLLQREPVHAGLDSLISMLLGRVMLRADRSCV
jgi:hypothetical protein